MGHEGIGAWYIHQHVSVIPGFTKALGIGHGFSGPVAGMLVHAGQVIKEGAFSYIGVTCYGNDLIFGCLFFYLQSGIDSSHSY